MAQTIERVEAHYESSEMPFGKVYEWHPGYVVLECECGEKGHKAGHRGRSRIAERGCARPVDAADLEGGRVDHAHGVGLAVRHVHGLDHVGHDPGHVVDDAEGYEELGERWRRGMNEAASAGDVPFAINQIGSMVSLFFTGGPVTDFASAAGSDTEAFKDFFWHMISRGIYLAPSQYEAGFISAAHSEQDLAKTFEAAHEWFTKSESG
jgi:hypothetical protein